MTRHHSRAQEQRHQRIFARFARRIRRARGLRKTIELMVESFSDLLDADFDDLQAIIDLSELVAIHQPKLDRAEAIFRIRDVGDGSRRGNFQDIDDAVVQLSALFSLLAQLRRHYSKDSELIILILLAVEMLPRTASIIPNYIYVERYRRTLELAAILREPMQRAYVAALRSKYATLLAFDQRPEVLSLALDHFQEAVDEFADLDGEEIEGMKLSYGQCLNSFAQALQEKDFGDRISDLKRAIELCDQCRAISARHQHLGITAVSAQIRCVASNELFRRLGNLSENIGLLEEALEIGDEELEKLEKSSEEERGDAAYDLEFVRESLWLSIALKRALSLETKFAINKDEQINAALTAHCRQVLARQEEALAILGPIYSESFRQFSIQLGEERTPLSDS